MLLRYASTSLEGRATVDLSSLTPKPLDWLFGLSDDDLETLKLAGPAACEKALAGKKRGVVGLPLPMKSGEWHATRKDKAGDAPSYKSKIATRVRAFKEKEFSSLQIAM